jgi:hypothetical protein
VISKRSDAKGNCGVEDTNEQQALDAGFLTHDKVIVHQSLTISFARATKDSLMGVNCQRSACAGG